MRCCGRLRNRGLLARRSCWKLRGLGQGWRDGMGRGFCGYWRRGDNEIPNTCRTYYWCGRIAGISPNEPPRIHVHRDDRPANCVGWKPWVCSGESAGWWVRTAICCWRNDRIASRSNFGERVREVCFTENLSDGRTIIVPVTWYPGFWTPPGNIELAGKKSNG